MKPIPDRYNLCLRAVPLTPRMSEGCTLFGSTARFAKVLVEAIYMEGILRPLVRDGILSGWATDKETAYQPPHTRGPEMSGLGTG